MTAVYTILAQTTDHLYWDVARERIETAGDEIDYHAAIDQAKADGYTFWSCSGGSTYYQTELRNEDGDIIRINLSINNRTCYDAGISGILDALAANEEIDAYAPIGGGSQELDEETAELSRCDTTYSIRVFTTEGRYACDTVTADNYTDAACMFLGAITWMDTDPSAAIEEVQLTQGDYVISCEYADATDRPLLNETIQTRALAEYREALASETKRWSYVGEIRSHYHQLIER